MSKSDQTFLQLHLPKLFLQNATIMQEIIYQKCCMHCKSTKFYKIIFIIIAIVTLNIAIKFYYFLGNYMVKNTSATRENLLLKHHH